MATGFHSFCPLIGIYARSDSVRKRDPWVETSYAPYMSFSTLYRVEYLTLVVGRQCTVISV